MKDRAQYRVAPRIEAATASETYFAAAWLFVGHVYSNSRPLLPCTFPKVSTHLALEEVVD